jgi:hypothetical protein
MEFTKLEQKILSTKHEKFQKLMLWIGIVFLIFSIAEVPYAINSTKKVKEAWEEASYSLNQEIKAKTKLEIYLKSMLLKIVNETKESEVRALKQKFSSGFIYLFFIGCYSISSYFISRIYLRLIRKLQNS